MTQQLAENSLRPMACIYCRRFFLIEFDLEIHLHENHTRYNPNIVRALEEGKKLGVQVDTKSLQQLNENFLACKQSPRQFISPEWRPSPTSQEVLSKIEGMKSFGDRQLDDSYSLTPIVSVESFFNESTLRLPPHSLEESPCYPIIDFKAAGKHILYSCELHPKIQNINLSSIEQHCKFFSENPDPDQHATEILSRIHREKVDGNGNIQP